MKNPFFKFKIIIAFSGIGLMLMACVPVIIGGGAAVGVLASREKGVTGTISDSQISTLIKAKLYNFNSELQNKVTVNVQNGEVLLAGTVKDPQWPIEAERIAWSVSGVRQVNNHIDVAEEESGAGALITDSWITSQIKTHLVLDGDIRSLNYSVKTLDGVVYVMGVAQTKEELEKVTQYASNINGVKKVVSYVRVKGEQAE